MNTITPFYLERHSDASNRHYFWVGWIDDNNLCVQKGRIGQKPKTLQTRCESTDDAWIRLHDLKNKAQLSGFKPATAPFEYSEREIEGVGSSALHYQPTASDYALHWETTGSGINRDDMEEAAVFVQQVISKLDVLTPVKALRISSSLGDSLEMSGDFNDPVLNFGFVQEEEWSGLSEAHQSTLQRECNGFRGLLTPNGHGAGSLRTAGSWVDLPVRLLLLKLSEISQLKVTCDYGVEYQGFFDNSNAFREFAWRPAYEEEIFPILKDRNFVHVGLLSNNNFVTDDFAW